MDVIDGYQVFLESPKKMGFMLLIAVTFSFRGVGNYVCLVHITPSSYHFDLL